MSRIQRDELLKALELKSEKIPLDFQGIFNNVTIYKREYQGNERIYVTPRYSGVTIIVKPFVRLSARKSSKHRTFILCPKCGKETPTGRLHQHIGTGTCK